MFRFGVFRLALQRLFNQFGLMASLAFGVAVAVMLTSAIPAFSDAVQLRVLQNRIDDNADNTKRPPFAFLFAYFGSINGQIEYEDFLKDDAFVTQRVSDVLQMPVSQTVRYVHTTKYRLFPASNSEAYRETNRQLEWLNIGYVSDFENHIQVFGELPKVRDDGVIEALIYSELANEVGLQAGEDYILYGAPKRGAEPLQMKIHVTGIWVEKNAEDTYWFYRPDAFNDNLIVNQDIYAKQVAPSMPADTELSLWYFDVDGRGLDPDQVPFLLGRMARMRSELNSVRTGLSVRISPEQALARFVAATNELTLLLVIFSVPMLAVVLYFVGLVAGMVVRRQEGEISVLRSRGASSGIIALLYIIAGLVIGVVALGLGLAGGWGLASLMTQMTTFLTFSGEVPLPVRLGNQAIRFAVGAAVISIVASLLPAIAASRRNIVSYRSSLGRTTRPPFWQRMYLDVLLLIPSVYLYTQMRNSGGVLLGNVDPRTADPFSDPIRFLAPVLMLSASALLLVRFFPLVMRGLAWLAGRFPVNTSVLLALRSLARAPVNYVGPLLLLIFTMGLAVFSSSIANTLDRHLVDSTYFRNGADVRMIETGDSNQKGMPGGGFGAPPSANTASSDGGTSDESAAEEPVYYTFVPVQEHLRIPGVKAASRIGTYRATLKITNAPSNAEFVGIDRADYPQTGYFRTDFANQTLGDLMNSLAEDPSGILVSEDFLAKARLRIGEPLPMSISTISTNAPVITFTIVGTYRMFPKELQVNADDNGPAEQFIGNLDYFFENAGTPLPYDVLLSTDPRNPESGLNQIVDRAGSLGFLVLAGYDARNIIREAQARPERQGVFGLLSAGFISASLLTIIGFVLSALISFRARAIQLGMLRTVGLSAVQMGTFIVLEQIILIGLGAFAGSALGYLVSRLFIPFMQVGGSMAANVPPFIVRIAWENLAIIYSALAVALFFALAVMLLLLRRLKAFEAIKLGAT